LTGFTGRDKVSLFHRHFILRAAAARPWPPGDGHLALFRRW